MLLEIRNLIVDYVDGEKRIRAVDNVTLGIESGEFVSIVGESGCGKSTLAYSILRLVAGEIVSGEIIFNGRNLLALSENEIKKVRGKEISMIFQDPMTSLDPLEKIGTQIVETLQTHEKISKKDALEKAKKLLEAVGIPGERVKDYPHQLSGGQRQRVMIALAIALNPKLIIADEPTTALDVIVQEKILELLLGFKKDGKAIIFITHDLALAVEKSDKIAVMYAGWLVEYGGAKEIVSAPLHPYTKGLINSVPDLWTERKVKPLKGFPPDLSSPPSGCRFSERCSDRLTICSMKEPPVKKIKNRLVRCWLYEKW